MQLKFDDRWLAYNTTYEELGAGAERLRGARTLHGSSLRYFELAATLTDFSRFEYPLASLAFFQAVIGLEQALRINYQERKESLSELMCRAHRDTFINDSKLSSAPPFTKEFRKQFSKLPVSHAEVLVLIVPMLRNQFFHGHYLLAPDYFHLSIQLREIADQLDTTKAPPPALVDNRIGLEITKP